MAYSQNINQYVTRAVVHIYRLTLADIASCHGIRFVHLQYQLILVAFCTRLMTYIEEAPSFSMNSSFIHLPNGALLDLEAHLRMLTSIGTILNRSTTYYRSSQRLYSTIQSLIVRTQAYMQQSSTVSHPMDVAHQQMPISTNTMLLWNQTNPSIVDIPHSRSAQYTMLPTPVHVYQAPSMSQPTKPLHQDVPTPIHVYQAPIMSQPTIPLHQDVRTLMYPSLSTNHQYPPTYPIPLNTVIYTPDVHQQHQQPHISIITHPQATTVPVGANHSHPLFSHMGHHYPMPMVSNHVPLIHHASIPSQSVMIPVVDTTSHPLPSRIDHHPNMPMAIVSNQEPLLKHPSVPTQVNTIPIDEISHPHVHHLVSNHVPLDNNPSVPTQSVMMGIDMTSHPHIHHHATPIVSNHVPLVKHPSVPTQSVMIPIDNLSRPMPPIPPNAVIHHMPTQATIIPIDDSFHPRPTSHMGHHPIPIVSNHVPIVPSQPLSHQIARPLASPLPIMSYHSPSHGQPYDVTGLEDMEWGLLDDDYPNAL